VLIFLLKWPFLFDRYKWVIAVRQRYNDLTLTSFFLAVPIIVSP